MKTETHDLINKDEVIGTTEVQQFSSLPEAAIELGERKCVQYINKMWKNVQVNKARALKLRESGTGAEVRNMIAKKAKGLTSEQEREEFKGLMGVDVKELT